MSKRIIFLTQWFDPEPAYHGEEFVRDLIRAGFHVEVVTGFPNYPGGKIYDGYKIRPYKKTESKKGFTLTRLALYPSHSKSKLGRILNYLSFFLSATFYLTFFARSADLVYVYHPPLTVGLAAALSKYIRRWPIILTIQDLWPDTLKTTGMINNPVVLKIIGWSAVWLYRKADHIIVQSWGFKKQILKRGVKELKTSVIINWTNEVSNVNSPNVPNFNEKHQFRVLFAGNLGPAQDLYSVTKAAKILYKSNPSIGFYFLGSGIEKVKLQKYVRENNLENVVFWPRVSSKDVMPYLLGADALLVHLENDPLFSITIPSKTQAYLYAGKPIIMGVSGDAAYLIRKSGGGLVVTPSDPYCLSDTIKKMSEMPCEQLNLMGDLASEFYDKYLCKEKGFASFVGIFKDVMAGRIVDKKWGSKII